MTSNALRLAFLSVLTVTVAACSSAPKPTNSGAVLIVGSQAAGSAVLQAAVAAGLDPVIGAFQGADADIQRFCSERGNAAPDIIALNREMTVADATACAQTGFGYDEVAGPGGAVLFRIDSYRRIPGLVEFRDSL